MPYPYCVTSIIIRLLTGDDLAKQERAFVLFRKVEQGQISLAAPVTVIADAVFVLTSKRLYNLPRADVAGRLTTLARLPHFHVQHRHLVLRALELFGTTTNLDFGDTMLLALMRSPGPAIVYSYDMDFDRIPGVAREEP